VVSSGFEVRAIHGEFPGRLRVLVPGVRRVGGATHDQARVVSPSEAALAGAAYVVLGRAVTGADDPPAALAEIVAELSKGTLPQVP
jgi:orotidine-5'-phosphate decarboxylase